MLRVSALLLVMASLLAACSNAPEQPSDEPDTQPDLMVDESDTTLPPIPEPETTPSVSSADVIGSWATDPSQCADPAGPPVTITVDRFESAEEACDIDSLVDSGAGFTASLTCTQGDATDAALLKLTPDGDNLALSWVGRDEGEAVLSRCE